MERERFELGREIKIVPFWAVIVAVVLFFGTPFAFFRWIWPFEEAPPPLALQILLPAMASSVLSLLVLLIGYVNKDAGRRGMSRTLWTLLVIFIPNAIGFVIYFLVRNPLLLRCPKCGTQVDSKANYCPSCRFGFRPTCPQCKSAINAGDRFCPKCGLEQGAKGDRVTG